MRMISVRARDQPRHRRGPRARHRHEREPHDPLARRPPRLRRMRALIQGLSVGLHVDVGESICLDGEWTVVYQRVDCRNPRELEAEIREQVSICRELLGRDPTHLDSHQHIHNEEPARSILDGIAAEMGVPLRHRSPVISYDGRFYGQTNTGELAARQHQRCAPDRAASQSPDGRDGAGLPSGICGRSRHDVSRWNERWSCRRCAIPTCGVCCATRGSQLIGFTDLCASLLNPEEPHEHDHASREPATGDCSG